MKDQTPPDLAANLAVVVCTRDRPEMLQRTVDSLVQHLRPTDDVVIVDSASKDPSAVPSIAGRAGYRSVRLELPGASRARNAGVGATQAPLLAFTDDDCLITEGWSAGLERALADPAVGFVTGRLIADEETSTPLVFAPEEPRRFEGASQDPRACGASANLGLRRAAFDSIGGFDELLGPGARLGVAEDHDLFWRVLRAGWVGLYDPSVTVVHRQWRTRGEGLKTHFAYGRGSGAFAIKAVRLKEKSGWRFLRTRVWGEGLVRAAKSLRSGYETGAATDVARTVGVVVGAVRASWIKLDAGRYTDAVSERRRARK